MLDSNGQVQDAASNMERMMSAMDAMTRQFDQLSEEVASLRARQQAIPEEEPVASPVRDNGSMPSPTLSSARAE